MKPSLWPALLLLSSPVWAQSGTEPEPRQLPLQYDSAPQRTSYPPVVPPSSPLRRTATAESRLTCEDYSLVYFSRHPAMAAVCGVNAEAELQARANPCGTDTSPTEPSSTEPVLEP